MRIDRVPIAWAMCVHSLHHQEFMFVGLFVH